MIDTVETGDGALLRVAGNPIKLSAIEAARDTSIPTARIARPGEHTRTLLLEVFGVGEDELRQLEREGVILDTSLEATE